MTPEREAELRRIAAGEDWSPPQPEDLTELLGEIDALRTGVTIFQDQRDGALATIRALAEPLRRLAGLRLEADPVSDYWGFVQYYALHLLRFAGLPQPPRARSGAEIQWGIRVHHGDPDGEISSSVLTGYTETGARHRAITEFEHAEPVYRHLGPWLDAPAIPDDTKDPE